MPGSIKWYAQHFYSIVTPLLKWVRTLFGCWLRRMFRISTTYRYGILSLQAHLPVAVLWRKMTTPLTVVALLATLVALDTAQLSRKLRTLNGQDRELYIAGIPVHLTADDLLLHTLPSLNRVSRGSSISHPIPKCFPSPHNKESLHVLCFLWCVSFCLHRHMHKRDSEYVQSFASTHFSNL